MARALVGVAPRRRSASAKHEAHPCCASRRHRIGRLCAEDANRAQSLARRHLIVDTNIDAPYRLLLGPVDLGESVPEREFDFPRAMRGGLDAAFMSIFTPARAADAGESRRVADQLVDLVESAAERHPAKFVVATCANDIEGLRSSGIVALALGMENASPLEGSAEVLDFAARGIRYVSLAHAKSNRYADSSYDLDERWGGLSDRWKQTVAEINRRGVMQHISHLSDKTAWQVLELSQTPVIASHSSLRYFVPGLHRNMDDDRSRPSPTEAASC